LATLASAVPEMIAGVEIENGSCDPDHTLLGMACRPKARILYSLPVCQI